MPETLTSGIQLIDDDGMATLRFQLWMQEISDAVNGIPPLTGTGTPLGAVAANPGRWYVDTSAGAGTGIYFKEANFDDTGWVARS